MGLKPRFVFKLLSIFAYFDLLQRAYDDDCIQAAKLEEFLFGGKDASRKDASSLFARQDNVQGIPQVCVLCSHTKLDRHGRLDTPTPPAFVQMQVLLFMIKLRLQWDKND